MAGAFVAAYAPYVLRVFDHAGDLVAATAEGEAWLADAMATWAAAPSHEQQASPLELFREALAFPTEAALAAGAAPAVRDDAATAALPGDVLAVAPMTSRELGEDAWQAHVAWGIARAEAVAGVVPRTEPRSGLVAVLVGTDLMDRTRIASAAESAGHELVIWRNPGAVATGLAAVRPVVVFVDLTHPMANDILRLLQPHRLNVVAFGPHVDDFALAAAKALGATDALPRSRFFKRLPELFPRLA